MSSPHRSEPDGYAQALILGGGIAGLAAAWELRQRGLTPLVCEARGYTGGLVASARIGGVPMDLGAEAFVVRGEAVTQIVQAVGLEVCDPSGGRPGLFLPGLTDADPWALYPFPEDSFLGIPSHPLAADVVRVIGDDAAARAARDAQLPGHVGCGPDDPRDVASFVRARMGQAVVDRLVGPIVAGIHAADPSVLDADTVAPGMREATQRTGSLQAAVAELLARRRRTAPTTRATDVTTYGGLTALTDAMRAYLEGGAEEQARDPRCGRGVFTRVGAQQIRPVVDCNGCPTGQWDVDLAPTAPGAMPSDEPVPQGPVYTIRTPRLVVATSAGPAMRLLGGAGIDAQVRIPAGAPIARFMMVVRCPGLDGAPVGSGLLVAPGDGPTQAKALSHLSVKWPWIGAQLRDIHGPGVHALRLSYGRPGQASPQISLEQALADACLLTGVPMACDDVIDHRLIHWDGTLPPLSPQIRRRTAAVCADAAARPGLALTGAWVAGSGIAAVVDHARAGAARLAGDGCDHSVPGLNGDSVSINARRGM